MKKKKLLVIRYWMVWVRDKSYFKERSRTVTTVREGGFIISIYSKVLQVGVEVNLRPTVIRPVCLGVKRPSGTSDQFFFLLEMSFRQLPLCYFVATSLTKGRVCNLLVQLILSLARAVTLRSKSRRTQGHTLLSHLRLPKPGRPGSRIYIPRNRVAQLYPRALNIWIRLIIRTYRGILMFKCFTNNRSTVKKRWLSSSFIGSAPESLLRRAAMGVG
jgi:hypothetical protein